MTTATGVNNAGQNNFHTSLSTNSSAAKKEATDQEMFMELMIAQLKNQNPLEPQKGGEFLAQLAQFSTVEGINGMNTQMQDMANSFRSNSALQATTLVGRSVRVPGNEALNTGSGISGTIELSSSSTNVSLIVKKNGVEVNRIGMGQQAKGELAFQWNGQDAEGNATPAGLYTVEAVSMVKGKAEAVQVNVNTNVDSVTLPSKPGDEIMVNVIGIGPIPLSSVKQVSVGG